MSSSKFVFFGPIGNTRWPPWNLIGWYIFDFFFGTAERNLKKFDRKQDINVLYQVCAFSGGFEKQDGRPSLWLAESFSTSPQKPLNGIQRHVTGSKISTSSTKFGFFGPIGKTRWPYWRLIGWHIFDFFSETAERNSMKLDRKQHLNVFYQVFAFRPMSKQKLPPWLICKKGSHIVLRCTICGPLGLLLFLSAMVWYFWNYLWFKDKSAFSLVIECKSCRFIRNSVYEYVFINVVIACSKKRAKMYTVYKA